jgi:hypothetical protein
VSGFADYERYDALGFADLVRRKAVSLDDLLEAAVFTACQTRRATQHCVEMRG